MRLYSSGACSLGSMLAASLHCDPFASDTKCSRSAASVHDCTALCRWGALVYGMTMSASPSSYPRFHIQAPELVLLPAPRNYRRHFDLPPALPSRFVIHRLAHFAHELGHGAGPEGEPSRVHVV